jgi:hypothetical protein
MKMMMSERQSSDKIKTIKEQRKNLPKNAELSGVRNSCEMYRTYIFFDSIRAYYSVQNKRVFLD